MREHVVERELCNLCRAAGYWCVKLTVLGRRGFPDRMVLCPGGRIYFVECKRPGAFARATQALVHRTLRRLGFQVFVVDTPEAAADVVALIQAAGVRV